MKFTVTLKGDKELIAELGKYDSKVNENLRVAIGEGCVLIEGEAKTNHPWKTRTARLASSITHNIKRTPSGEYVGKVGTNVEYGKYLEFGTRRMRKFAWLYPAFAKYAKQILVMIEQAVKRSAK
jgi:HK97 gp10 family phage protein